MKNGILAIIVLGGLFCGCYYLAFRLGMSNCRESVATETNKVQQMVQESDRNITEKVLSDSHANNLRWMYENYKRAD